MEVLKQLLYEYQRGVRDLLLHTCPQGLINEAEKVLMKHKIDYLTFYIGDEKVNLFFGNPQCLEIVQEFSSDDLSKLTAEEDFILGMMLGYSKQLQYTRYLTLKENVKIT